MAKARIREIFLAAGFTVKEGQTDLKQYVYDAAYALLAEAPKPAQQATALCDCKGRFYDRCGSAWEPCCVLGKSGEHAAVSNPVPKPNVRMDGYVRTDRPNGDGL